MPRLTIRVELPADRTRTDTLKWSIAYSSRGVLRAGRNQFQEHRVGA